MNALTNGGQSALGKARRRNHPAIVELLRTRGAIDDEEEEGGGGDDDDDGIIDDDDDE
jgi:hypothetical protein